MTKDKPTATITVRNASDYTRKGRRKIAAWLRECAEHLEKNGDDYASRMTSRLTLVHD